MRSGATESRQIAEKEEAVDLYEDLISDAKVNSVRVVESAERDIRFFEREARRGENPPASAVAS